jgi:DNA-binding HxlR family transcriptional regulator
LSQETGGVNAVGRMLGLLGDEWTLLIAQQALLGVTRYGDFTTRLPISHAVLTRRLAAMTADGLLVRSTYQDKPPRSEYLLTPRGGCPTTPTPCPACTTSPAMPTSRRC